MQEIVFKTNTATENIAVKCSTAELSLLESDSSLTTMEKKISKIINK